MKRLFFFLPALFFLFFFVPFVSAEVFEDFENMASGTSVCLDADWSTCTASSTIVTEEKWLGNQSLRFDNGSGNTDYDFVNESTDIESFVFYVYMQSLSTGSWFVNIRNSSSLGISGFYLDSVTKKVSHRYPFVDSGLTFEYNEWIRVEIQNDTVNDLHRMNVNFSDWTTWVDSGQSDTRSDTIRFTSQNTNTSVYLDNFSLNLNIDNSDVDVIEIPDSDNNVYVANQFFSIDKRTSCLITATSTCEIRFKYPFDDIGKTVVLYDEENNQEDSKLLVEQNQLKGFLTPEAPTATSTISYCVTIISELSPEIEYCGIKVDWAYDSLGIQLDFEPYDIDTACEDVATSSGSTWDDFRYGMECALNKTLYWSFHPQDETWYNLEKNKNQLLDEFPLNIYNVIWYDIFNTQDSGATTTVFELPLFVGELNSNGSTTIVAWRSSDLFNTFGSVWTDIYAFMTVILYFFTFVYFFNWFIKHRQQ